MIKNLTITGKLLLIVITISLIIVINMLYNRVEITKEIYWIESLANQAELNRCLNEVNGRLGIMQRDGIVLHIKK